MSLETHVVYALRNTPVKRWPFPHFYAENVFPWDHYWEIIDFLAKKTDFKDSKDYQSRSFAQAMDLPGVAFMETPEFMRHIMGMFEKDAHKRFTDGKAELYMDLRLVRDGQGYQIGPHTDAPWKVLSLLFYFPPKFDVYQPYGQVYEEYGTSIFVPKPQFGDYRCEGGPHYDFEKFDKVWTAPYVPNSCFGFWKTDNAFHGVEPVAVQFTRDVLLFNVYEKTAFDAAHAKPEEKPEE